MWDFSRISEVVIPHIDPKLFRRFLVRNVSLPLALGLVNCALFVGLILYLLSVNRWVDHTDRVISQARYLEKILIDAETGLRGYAVTGDRDFLEPFENATSIADAQFGVMRNLVQDNPLQAGRVAEIESGFKSWLRYADSIKGIVAKRGEVEAVVAQKAGKRMMDGIRRLFDAFTSTEQALRDERSSRIF